MVYESVRWYTVVYDGGRSGRSVGAVGASGTRWYNGAREARRKGVICIYIQWVAPAKCEEQMYNGIYSAVYCPGGRRGPTRATCG